MDNLIILHSIYFILRLFKSYSITSTGRRNPLRMLSNAIDFRVRTKKLMNQHHSRKKEGGSVDSNSSSNRLSSFEFGRNRPKSADFEKVIVFRVSVTFILDDGICLARESCSYA